MTLTNKQKATLLISSSYGIGTAKGNRLLRLEGVESIAENLAAFRTKILTVIGERDYKELCVSAANIDYEKTERELEKKGVRYVSILDEEYPKALLAYEDAPLGLYCIGDVSLLNKMSFAVVGTRFPTRYGARVTEEFSAKLSERFCIVSGMARGVDSIAHKAALDAGGRTIAVFGCGVDVVYPPENRQLYEAIKEYGLIVSEFPPGTQATAHNFPSRNRIISGLSRAVLITEAGEKSGTMITLQHSLEQGKDVFCVPGSIYSKTSAGCNRAIKECQTRMALDVNDIYDELGLTKVDTKKPSSIQLDVNEDNILQALTKNGEMHFEEILEVADLSVSQLNALLIKMTAMGLITKTKHNYWSI